MLFRHEPAGYEFRGSMFSATEKPLLGSLELVRCVHVLARRASGGSILIVVRQNLLLCQGHPPDESGGKFMRKHAGNFFRVIAIYSSTFELASD